MKFITHALALVGLVFISANVYLSLDWFVEHRVSKSLISGDHDCDSQVRTRTGSNQNGLLAQYIVYDCDGEHTHKIEVTKYADAQKLANWQVPVRVKNDDLKNPEPDIYLAISEDSEVLVMHSESISVEGADFGDFRITTSPIQTGQ